jgi:ABC-type protease/lipase transport system fused ATPase/permease subunit
MSATTNTVIATVDAEVPTVPTVPSTLITTAAILIAAKGKGYAKQVKNKMEKTKNAIVGNTTDGYTLVKELYSHSMMLLQQTMFQTENTTSGEEFSTSVGKFMDCIETLSGSIQQNIASLKKIKQKLAHLNLK